MDNGDRCDDCSRVIFLSGIVFCASVLGLCQLKVTLIACMPLACNWH